MDFASLYPSVFRAYNLCYTTLLHKSDLALLSKEDYITTPTGTQLAQDVTVGIGKHFFFDDFDNARGQMCMRCHAHKHTRHPQGTRLSSPM